MNWNQRYASEDNINLNIDADFTPNESFKNIADRIEWENFSLLQNVLIVKNLSKVNKFTQLTPGPAMNSLYAKIAFLNIRVSLMRLIE